MVIYLQGWNIFFTAASLSQTLRKWFKNTRSSLRIKCKVKWGEEYFRLGVGGGGDVEQLEALKPTQIQLIFIDPLLV